MDQQFKVSPNVLYSIIGGEAFVYTKTVDGVEVTDESITKICNYFYNLGKKHAFGQSGQTPVLLLAKPNRKETPNDTTSSTTEKTKATKTKARAKSV